MTGMVTASMMPSIHRQRVTANLEERGHGLDAGAATQQRRRLSVIGDWQAFRNES